MPSNFRGRRDLGGYQEEDDAPPAKRRPGDLRTVFSRYGKL